MELAGQGFELQVIETDGSIENADLLRKGHADIALVQSDGSGPGDADGRAGGSLPTADHGAL